MEVVVLPNSSAAVDNVMNTSTNLTAREEEDYDNDEENTCSVVENNEDEIQETAMTRSSSFNKKRLRSTRLLTNNDRVISSNSINLKKKRKNQTPEDIYLDKIEKESRYKPSTTPKHLDKNDFESYTTVTAKHLYEDAFGHRPKMEKVLKKVGGDMPSRKSNSLTTRMNMPLLIRYATTEIYLIRYATTFYCFYFFTE